MSERGKRLLETAVAAVLIALFAFVSVGTLAIPVLLAIRFSWWWVFSYPVLFIGMVIIARRNNKK